MCRSVLHFMQFGYVCDNDIRFQGILCEIPLLCVFIPLIGIDGFLWNQSDFAISDLITCRDFRLRPCASGEEMRLIEISHKMFVSEEKVIVEHSN